MWDAGTVKTQTPTDMHTPALLHPASEQTGTGPVLAGGLKGKGKGS